MKIPFKVSSKEIILLLTFTLSGCESFIKLQAWPPPYSLPAGATLTINRDLSVAPNSVSVWIQSGKVTNTKNIDLGVANCHFEFYTLRSKARILHKDNVVIRRFVNSDEYVSRGKVMYASLTVAGDDVPMARIVRTEMYLKSEKQPDLYRLTCEVWKNLSDDVYLTMDQIQQALGNVATFHTPE